MKGRYEALAEDDSVLHILCSNCPMVMQAAAVLETIVWCNGQLPEKQVAVWKHAYFNSSV